MSHSLISNRSASTQRSTSKLTKTVLASAIFAVGTCASVTSFAQSSVDKRIEALEKEINDLKSQVSTAKPAAGEVKPGTTFEYGGFIKADFIYSDYSGAERSNSIGDDFLVPSVIAIESDADDGDAVFDAHAKHSRMFFKTTTKAGNGAVISYIEVDFNSTADERLVNPAANGLRHAFLQYKYNATDSVLAGQFWTTFMNTTALPETIDFVGPTSGTLFVRQAQLRWTKGIGEGNSFSLAAENPSSGLYDGGAGFNNNNYDSNSVPDMIARYDGTAGDFSYSFAGVLREIAYNDGGMSDEDWGAGLNFAGIYSMGNGDKLKMSFSYGALGRYIALNAFRDGAVEADGGIDTVDVMGGFLAYEHAWSDQWRSTFLYAYSTADNPSSAGDAVNKTVSNANVNILYSPVPKLTFGAELIFAERELESGDSGDLTRLQFMGKWVF